MRLSQHRVAHTRSAVHSFADTTARTRLPPAMPCNSTTQYCPSQDQERTTVAQFAACENHHDRVACMHMQGRAESALQSRHTHAMPCPGCLPNPPETQALHSPLFPRAIPCLKRLHGSCGNPHLHIPQPHLPPHNPSSCTPGDRAPAHRVPETIHMMSHMTRWSRRTPAAPRGRGPVAYPPAGPGDTPNAAPHRAAQTWCSTPTAAPAASSRARAAAAASRTRRRTASRP